MYYCITITTVVDDVHAHPHIYITENPLLTVLVFPSVIQEHAVQKLVIVDGSERDELDCSLAVATQSGLYLRRISPQARIHYVLSRIKLQLDIDVTFIVCR
jgi:hypothetical protein